MIIRYQLYQVFERNLNVLICLLVSFFCIYSQAGLCV